MTKQPTKTEIAAPLAPTRVDELLEEFGDPEYTRDQFEADRVRVLTVLCAKHDIAESEVDTLIKEHRYTHSFEDPERSPLALLSEWLCRHPGQIAIAPLDLLADAAADVVGRLPTVAAREPTRRHRRHFAWLIGWHQRITSALAQGTS